MTPVCPFVNSHLLDAQMHCCDLQGSSLMVQRDGQKTKACAACGKSEKISICWVSFGLLCAFKSSLKHCVHLSPRHAVFC